MSTGSTDRVMQTLARYFEVAAEGTDRACWVEDAARRASADPEFRDALAQVLEADCPQGSFSACTNVRDCDSGADAIAWLPDGTGCGTGQVYALQAKVRDAAGSDPRTGSYLALLLTAAIHVDRSSLGTAEAWSLRRQPSAGDLAAVRETWRRLLAADVTFQASPEEEAATEERREPECPGLAPDPLRASTPAEFAAALARFRRWAGEPSFREMARQGRPAVSPSTLATAVHAERLPTLRVVSAFVTACGGGPEEVARFATAWRRIRHLGRPSHHVQGQSAATS
jgi:hypothetical protein